MNIKSLLGLGFVFLVIILMVTACTPATTPPPSATIVPSETPVQSTSTPIPTATPVLTLKCNFIKVDVQQARAANVYGVTGELVGSGNIEISALQIDIIGESGQITSNGNVATEADYNGNLNVKIDDEWTYSDSKNVYKVTGTIVYKITDLEKQPSYAITVSGDGFGSKSQTCKSP